MPAGGTPCSPWPFWTAILEHLHANLLARTPIFEPAPPHDFDAEPSDSWTMITGLVRDPESGQVLTFWNEYVTQSADERRTYEVKVDYVTRD